jgi:hypothetical protein
VVAERAVTLTVHVRPRAHRDEVVLEGHAVLRVRVTAPPAEGAANAAVRRVLARRLGCAPSAVEILRGRTARTKLVRVVGVSAEDVVARLRGAG